MDGPGGIRHIDAERPGHGRLDGPSGGGLVEAHGAAGEPLRIEIAEDQVGVGDGRPRAATAVAGRPRLGARALRPNLNEPERVDLGDAAAARSDLDHADRRGRDGKAARLGETTRTGDLELVGQWQDAVADQAGLRRRTAHVVGDHLRQFEETGESLRHHRAGDRPGFDQPHWEVCRGSGRADTAIRQHDLQRCRKPALAGTCFEPAEIAAGQGLHVGVDHRRRAALELTDLGQHVRRQRDRDAVQGGGEQVARGALVGRVREGMQEADRDGRDLLLPQQFGNAGDLAGID